MAKPDEAVSVLVVVEFVVVASVVLFLVPLEVAAPLAPLLLFFLAALWTYCS